MPQDNSLQLTALFAGTVEDNADPLKMGRLRCRVPVVYGTSTTSNPDGSSIATTDLPWAYPAGLPAGATNDSGMIGWLPGVGDHVYVMFLDAEPEKPVWIWGNQDTNQVPSMGGWTRSPGGYTGGTMTAATATSPASTTPAVAPASAFMTRYGHIFDFQPDTTTWRTASGYFIRFTDSTQQLDVYSPNMVGLIGALKLTGQDFQFNPSNTFKVSTGDATYSANTNEMKAAVTNTLTAIANKLDSPLVQLGPEGSAYDPVVRLSDLAAICTQIITIYTAHTHTGNLGYPTSPPLVPMVLTPSGSSTSFTA